MTNFSSPPSRPSLPAPNAVGNLLSGLLSRSVKVSRSIPPAKNSLVPVEKATQAVAIYTNDDGVVAAVCVYDMPLASSAGAALSMIPQGVANEAVRKGVMPESVAENLYEVANVSASLFNVDGGPHLKLKEVVTSTAALPAPVKELVAKAADRIDLDVNIAGYSAGRMSLLVKP